ncbi:uncharacterized protein PV09_02445 [Verruconis gallopava]|uniref:Uncharacterized protein n=1 Tax=Verruconis gallopava TaxID=253628 RepID=A0A0D2AJI6_9PEZI|nr:uncharacterized protein PV09_02445 [Verruconis gallopava]KIW06755.1 hypothetical protein PV09_02445 [Verruconis gallopava]
MTGKCVHKGCGKVFTDPDEPCVYHPGPAVFHEGQKGYQCCKPRVLTFDEFLSIPPCTTGKHSTTDEGPLIYEKPREDLNATLSQTAPADTQFTQPAVPRLPQSSARASPSPAPPPESEDDDPDTPVPDGATCRRRGCGQTYKAGSDRSGEQCVHHPGAPLFHEGSKGYTCCKRRVLEFDQFLKIEGCKTKDRHLFVGAKKKPGHEEKLDTVRHDFYQTATTVNASLYLKKIDKEKSTVKFVSETQLDLDLVTLDNKRFQRTFELFGPIDPGKSTFKILSTKLELTLQKADGQGWPVLKADDPQTGEIIQAGRAGRV